MENGEYGFRAEHPKPDRSIIDKDFLRLAINEFRWHSLSGLPVDEEERITRTSTLLPPHLPHPQEFSHSSFPLNADWDR